MTGWMFGFPPGSWYIDNPNPDYFIDRDVTFLSPSLSLGCLGILPCQPGVGWGMRKESHTEIPPEIQPNSPSRTIVLDVVTTHYRSVGKMPPWRSSQSNLAHVNVLGTCHPAGGGRVGKEATPWQARRKFTASPSYFFQPPKPESESVGVIFCWVFAPGCGLLLLWFFPLGYIN